MNRVWSRAELAEQARRRSRAEFVTGAGEALLVAVALAWSFGAYAAARTLQGWR